MSHPQLDRHQLSIAPLCSRSNKIHIERDHVPADTPPSSPSRVDGQVVAETVERIKRSRESDRPVMLAFGAHAIKNGLAPVLISLMEDGWITHLATNGAGIIHDWEFAFLGRSSEDVKGNVDKGQFGIWEETGRYLNLAINVGAYEGLGYGESVGSMIHNGGLTIPGTDELKRVIDAALDEDADRAAGAADLCGIVRRFGLKSGFMEIAHPYKHFSVQSAAYRLNIPFTAHPMIGHDIIYNHPMNHGAAIGRAALRDFLSYAWNINRIEGGVYLSVGSAVMSPMIFEKALSMAQNLHIQKGGHIDNHFIVVVDLAESTWDWQKNGEPPGDNPAFYLRYCKTFSRMGGEMRYLCADNREFLLSLREGL